MKGGDGEPEKFREAHVLAYLCDITTAGCVIVTQLCVNIFFYLHWNDVG